MFYVPAILIGRAVRSLIRRVRPGGGSALPGLVLSKIAPGLLAKTLKSFPDGLVVVTGSAGKSTTTKMLVAIARAHGKDVFTNPSTANIAQGFYSAILERSNLFGKISGDVAILEMDEGHAAEITSRVAPAQSTILNVLEDQLDRFVDPAVVREKLSLVAERTTGAVLLNADDQNTLLIGSTLKSANRIEWFGITQDLITATRHGLGAAPTYLADLPHPSVTAEIESIAGTHACARIDGQATEFDLRLLRQGDAGLEVGGDVDGWADVDNAAVAVDDHGVEHARLIGNVLDPGAVVLRVHRELDSPNLGGRIRAGLERIADDHRHLVPDVLGRTRRHEDVGLVALAPDRLGLGRLRLAEREADLGAARRRSRPRLLDGQ